MRRGENNIQCGGEAEKLAELFVGSGAIERALDNSSKRGRIISTYYNVLVSPKRSPSFEGK
jgi:hypothetical protein